MSGRKDKETHYNQRTGNKTTKADSSLFVFEDSRKGLFQRSVSAYDGKGANKGNSSQSTQQRSNAEDKNNHSVYLHQMSCYGIAIAIKPSKMAEPMTMQARPTFALLDDLNHSVVLAQLQVIGAFLKERKRPIMMSVGPRKREKITTSTIAPFFTFNIP